MADHPATEPLSLAGSETAAGAWRDRTPSAANDAADDITGGMGAARPGHVAYLDLFRGLAILQVVLIHAGNALLQRGIPAMRGDAFPVWAILHLLVHDATIYFAAISGILYAHLFWRRRYADFLKQRFTTIGIPYLVVTMALTLFFWLLAGLHDPHIWDVATLMRAMAVNIATGAVWNSLWYIPVILLLLLSSPALFAAVRLRRWRWLGFVILALPLILSRTGTDVTPSMIVYFAGAYMAGMMIGSDVDRRLDWLAARRGPLWAIALASSAALALMFVSGFNRLGFISLDETAFYVQRLALASLILTTLRARADSIPAPLTQMIRTMARLSFGIYFVHGPLLRPIAHLAGRIVPVDQPWWALVAAILLTFVAGLSLSLAIIHIAQRLVGRRSRLIIGA